MTIAQPHAEPQRDRYGRYLLLDGSGKRVAYTRATTVAETIDDRYNLELWKVRTAGLGLVQRPDLFAQVAACSPDDKKKLNALMAGAIEAAKGSAGANLGSALHTFTENRDRGEDVVVPSPWDADVAAYTATLEANGIHVEPGRIENIVALDGFRIAGTFDRVVRVTGRPLPMIADLKTGATLDFSWCAIAAQLAIYSRADRIYDPVSDTSEPMPKVDQHQALVIHLPAGQATCTLYLVDIEAGWDAVQHCLWVRDWRKRKDLAAPFVSTVEQRRAWLAERVTRLRDAYPNAFNELAQSWPADCPTFKQGGHTADQLELIALAISNVEARHQIAFPEGSDPVTAKPNRGLVDALIVRLQALPADLLEAVETTAKTLKVPNMKGHKFTVAHMQTVLELVADAEAAATSRTTSVVQETTTQRSSAA